MGYGMLILLEKLSILFVILSNKCSNICKQHKRVHYKDPNNNNNKFKCHLGGVNKKSSTLKAKLA
jgi:hypothetical protein